VRILHLYEDFAGEGGVPEQARRLAEAQLELGHDVFGLASLGEPIPTSVRLLSRRDTAHESWDAVHVHGVFLVRDVMQGLRLHPRRLWVSPHGVLNPLGIARQFGGLQHSRRRAMAKRLYIQALRPVLRLAAGVCAEAPYEAEVLQQLGVREPHVFPMGTNPEWLHPAPAPRTHDGCIAYLGRLDIFHKGLDALLDGIAAAKRVTGLEVRVRIIGSDANNAAAWLRAKSRELGLTRVTVEPPAWGADKDAMFEDADWLWAGFRYAGMARVCGEAIGRGVPLIASREGNWGDWATKFGFGISADVNDAAPALVRVVTMPPSEHQMWSRAATQFARVNTWRACAQRSVDMYKTSL
jgi:glycosyltransferase involved in cell wall biosynthesis